MRGAFDAMQITEGQEPARQNRQNPGESRLGSEGSAEALPTSAAGRTALEREENDVRESETRGRAHGTR
jgi:hypothetical protein